jgi:hypothetical protein
MAVMWVLLVVVCKQPDYYLESRIPEFIEAIIDSDRPH